MKGAFVAYSYKTSFSDSSIISNILLDSGFKVSTTSDLDSFSDNIGALIQNRIRQSELFIGFIEDNNPNVFFEIGYAMGLGKQVLIISSFDCELPTDLSSIRYIRAYPNSQSFVFQLKEYLEQLKGPAEEIVLKDVEHLLEVYFEEPEVFNRIDGKLLEEILFNWFVKDGYNARRNYSSYDHGYDFEIDNYGNSNKALVEVKKYNKNSVVSIGEIQKLLGSMYFHNAGRGILITSSDFTKAAKAFVERIQGDKQIELWTLMDVYKKIAEGSAKKAMELNEMDEGKLKEAKL